MSLRQRLFFTLWDLRGQPLGRYYHQFWREYQAGIPVDTAQRSLAALFQHCQQNVPYYAQIMNGLSGSYADDPLAYLRQFPILTKDIIRSQFEALKSTDLAQRKWYRNSSGGSTGQPVPLVQDWSYAAQSGAVKLLFSKLVGKEVGEPEVRLWGSAHDIARGTEGWRAKLINQLENVVFVNSVRMAPPRMRDFIDLINRSRPKLITSYAYALYEVAKFAAQEGLVVQPQAAIITSAATLYPFMRSKIEQVFQCQVYNRYGSREVGDIACEQPGLDGLWVPPWGNYVEIVDADGKPVPDGTEGEIVVTSLRNYAMPLIRYQIGDRGILSAPPRKDGQPATQLVGQVLQDVTGRSTELFRTRDGACIDPGIFMATLYFRNWIRQYQVIQKDYQKIVYRIVEESEPPASELDEIIAITRQVMGAGCEVTFEFLDEILPSPSGKFRFLISEVN